MIGRYFDRVGKVRALNVAAAVYVLVGGAGRAQAQKTPVAPALPAVFQRDYTGNVKDMSFDVLIENFSRITKISVVADGEPVLAKSDFAFKGTTRQALDQIADTFDFDWTVTKSGIVLMTKRFTSPKDRPQVSLIETRQIIKDMSRALQTVPFDAEVGFMPQQMQNIYNTLTPLQIQALRDKQVIPAAQLLPGAFDAMKAAILSNAFGRPLRAWNRLSEDLDLLPASFLQAQERHDPNGPVPHYYEIMWNRRARNGGLTGGSFSTVGIGEKGQTQNKTEGQP